MAPPKKANAKNNHRARQAAEYRRLRTEMLERDNSCAICGREANTIDHIRPVDTFEDPLEANHPDNLRVLCKSCNSRAGARYGNAKRGATNTQSGQNFLGQATFLPPDSSISVSEPNNIRVSQDSPNFCLDVPRLRTNTESGDRALLGDLVEFSEKVLGITLLPWQQLVLGDQLCRRPDGRLMFRQSLVSVARQNGKTWALKCLVAFWLCKMPQLRGEPQTVLTTAHRLDLASELFNSLAPVLEAKMGAQVIWSYGRQSLTMPDGSRWLVRAATPSAGHGLSCDLVVVDELFDCSSAAVDDALIPTMRARRDPLLSMWSTAGTSESTVMLRFRSRGMADIDTGRPTRFYLAEFSPPPHLNPMSPAAWPYANPALGHTLELETIEEESKTPNQQAFIRASVNCWVQSARSWIDPGLFESFTDTTPMPEDGGVLAVEAATDDSTFVGVRAVDVNGTVRVQVEFIVNSLPELWPAVLAARDRHKGLKFAIGGSLDLHLPRQLKGQVEICGVREIQRWTTLVLSMIRAGQVTHHGEHTLVEQVTRAVASKHQGHLTISSSRSPGPIELCRAMVWAVAMAGKPKAQTKAAYAFAD